MAEILEHCWSTIGIWSNTKSKCPRLEDVIHCHNCDVYRKATNYVYQREIGDVYRREYTDILQEQKIAGRVKDNSVLTFRLYGEWISFPSKYIKEIAVYRSVQAIPHNRNKYIQGIINISGEVEISFLLSKILGVDEGNGGVESDSYKHIVIAEYEGEKYVFPVSELGEIHRFHDDELQEVPATVVEDAGSFMTGILEWSGRKVGNLDAELLFSAINRSM